MSIRYGRTMMPSYGPLGVTNKISEASCPLYVILSHYSFKIDLASSPNSCNGTLRHPGTTSSALLDPLPARALPCPHTNSGPSSTPASPDSCPLLPPDSTCSGFARKFDHGRAGAEGGEGMLKFTMGAIIRV